MTVARSRNSRLPPLWRRAPAQPWRSATWASLVLLACTLLGIAAAAPPIFDEASGNASFAAQRAAVPATARASDAAVVRITGSVSPRSADQVRFTEALRAIDGLGTPVLTGTSVGAETATVPWQSAVRLGTREVGARLFAQDAPARSLTITSGKDAAPGVWLPQPLADELHAAPGDSVSFVVTTARKRKTTTVPLAGTYAVAGDRRTPADPQGGRQWTLRDGELPADREFRTLPALLVVTDVATAERLAARTGDRMLWTVESALIPGATLAQARTASVAVDALRRDLINASPVNDVEDVVQPNVITGIPTVVDAADEVAEVTSRRTTSLELASLVLGLASVVGIVVLALGRRRLELQHAVGSGLRPVSIAGLWVVEHVAPVLLGAAAGVGIARLLVGALGPDGRLTDDSLRTAAIRAAVAAVVGLLVIGALVQTTASATLRPQATGAPGRRVPWAALLVVAAATATVGLLGANTARGAPRGLDLLVPLLVTAATGTLVTLAFLRLAAATRRIRHRTDQRRRPWQLAAWVALRRITAPDRARTLVTAATATGLGMLLFALCAVSATTTSIDDRVSVQAGAEAAAQVPDSWLLDPGAAVRPADPAPDEPSLPPGPVAGVRTPPVPPGDAMVWRYPVNVSPEFSAADLLVVDPSTFVTAARWGDGDELAHSLAATEALVAADRVSARQVHDHGTAQVPVIAVGTTGLAPGDEVNIDNGHWAVRLRVTALATAYPGLGQRPMFVAPASTMLDQLGVLDPRLRPQSHTQPDGGPVETWLWSAHGIPGVDAVLTPLDLTSTRLLTAAQLRLQPTYVAVERAQLYQLALGTSLALLAVLSLALQADRAASRDRATDFMLARVGLGRAGVRAARAFESAFLAVVALVAAVVGVAVLLPLGARLLDFDPSLPPGLQLRLDAESLGVVGAVAALAALVAAGVAATRTAAGSEEVALRDTD